MNLICLGDNLIELKKAKSWPPKVGEYIITTDTPTGEHATYFRCPECEELATLDNHTLTLVGCDAVVVPSVVCPYDCKFHDDVKLVGFR